MRGVVDTLDHHLILLKDNFKSCKANQLDC